MNDLSHFDESGASRMVDVSEKAVTRRTATASGTVQMQAATLRRILDKDLKKGDVLEVARLAAIMATKKTDELIPLCHSLPLESASVEFYLNTTDSIEIRSTVVTEGKTGVEMEALTAVSVAALTIYDMCKSIDREMAITGIHLVEKTGGRSGHFVHSQYDKSK